MSLSSVIINLNPNHVFKSGIHFYIQQHKLHQTRLARVGKVVLIRLLEENKRVGAPRGPERKWFGRQEGIGGCCGVGVIITTIESEPWRLFICVISFALLLVECSFLWWAWPPHVFKFSLLFIDDGRLTKQRPKKVKGMLIYYSFPFN